MSDGSDFHDIAEVEAIPSGSSAGIQVEGERIALFNYEGQFFATQNACPHMGASIAGGPMLKGGRVRAIAAGASARLEALPEVSTTTEQGMPELITGNWWGLVAPKAKPARIVDRLAAEVRAALADPEVRKRYSEIGMEPGSGGPKELEALMKSEAARWKKVIDRAKVLVE